MNKIYSLIALAITSISFAQYSGTGTFTKVTNLTNLTDGYYVITGEDDDVLMTSLRSGTTTGGHFLPQDVTPINNSITNPSISNVWKIETTPSGKTIYNEVITKYVGWSAGNAASIEDIVTNSSTWTFTYSDSRFTVKNVATPARQLSYNASSPRFAAYGNASQDQLQFYKLTVAATPTLTASVVTITDLNYILGAGPSTSQTFNITGTNLNNSNVVITAPTNFEVSTNSTTFATTATLTSFNGTSTPVYVRLATGLAVNTYTGNISINGGGIATPITIATSGAVTPVPASPILTTSETTITGLNYILGAGPSTSQSFNISGTNLNNTDVVVTAPTNFEVSNDNTTFGDTTTLTTFNGTATPINVRLKSGLAVNTYTGNISITGGGIATPITVNLSGLVNQTASVKENNIEGLKVYPNPASDVINITSNEIGSKIVVIYNMLGKKVLEITTDETINVSNLNSGVYMMNILQNGKKASSKLVIK